MSLEQLSESEERYRLHRRFDRIGRLVGDDAMKRLFSSHVMVIGLGGVGSWAAEAVARSGVGRITLVDFDEICVTNFNRQLHALQGLVGSQKAPVVAERLRMINPAAEVQAEAVFYSATTSERLLGLKPDYIIDAIDSITSKCHLLARAKELSIPLVTATGSGGRMDPTQVRVKDLAVTELDPLARDLRRILRQKYGFPAKGLFGIPAVYSAEAVTPPRELAYDGGKGFRCVCPQAENEFFNCDSRNIIMGNAAFVTGAFGLACASEAVRGLLGGRTSGGETF